MFDHLDGRVYKGVSCKGKVKGYGMSATDNKLVADKGGYRPADTHHGVDKHYSAEKRLGTRYLTPRPSKDDANTPHLGRKHVKEEHNERNEATRRANNQAGVKKFSDTNSGCRTWGVPDDNSGCLQRGNPTGSTYTAEQLAIHKLEQESRSRPELGAKVQQAIDNGTAVQLEQQMQRQRRVQDMVAHRDPNATTPLRKSHDLGEATHTQPPYATAQFDAAPQQRGAKRTYNVDAITNKLRAEEERKAARQHVHRHPEGNELPYDTIESGGARYPEPPAVGCSVPFSVRHAGKHRPDNCRSYLSEQKDADTMSLERASARAAIASTKPAYTSNNSGGGMPQFIFGEDKPLPQKYSPLRGAFEARVAEANERPVTRGKAKSAASYKPTSLW